jgi:hypothetical protein
MTTVNKVENNTVLSSNTVFIAGNMHRVCVVDKDWLEKQLKPQYTFKHIANKYVIAMDGRLYARLDDLVWLVELRKDQK